MFLICSLLPFLFSPSDVGKVVFLNGVLCHGFPDRTCFTYWDILCNIVFAVYVNVYTSWQPQCFLITLISFVAWQWNRATLQRRWVHAVFVQWPLCVCLHRF